MKGKIALNTHEDWRNSGSLSSLAPALQCLHWRSAPKIPLPKSYLLILLIISKNTVGRGRADIGNAYQTTTTLAGPLPLSHLSIFAPSPAMLLGAWQVICAIKHQLYPVSKTDILDKIMWCFLQTRAFHMEGLKKLF
jgi:hypothetical protein